MTSQEQFNKVWNHFVVEKNPASYNPPSGFCSYRGPNGARCAAGVLIPDSVYTPAIEGVSFGALADSSNRHFNKAVADVGVNVRLVDAMQRAHDLNCSRPAFTEEMELSLRDVAIQFRLEVPSAQG